MQNNTIPQPDKEDVANALKIIIGYKSKVE
jgi:hypothetical protein